MEAVSLERFNFEKGETRGGGRTGAESLRLRGTIAGGKAAAFPNRYIYPNKTRWGGKGGLGGRGKPSRVSRGVPSPPNTSQSKHLLNAEGGEDEGGEQRGVFGHGQESGRGLRGGMGVFLGFLGCGGMGPRGAGYGYDAGRG